MDMKDKVVVVTGASSGIGRATAHAFAKRGASLLLAARSDQQLDIVEAECADLGVRAIGVPTDVGNNEEVEELGARAEREFGRFDVWVNNAGLLLLGRIDEAPVEDFERVIQTNLLGTSYGSRVALKHFRQRGQGTLINVSSIVSGLGQLYSSAYTASKWGVRGLSEALRMEVTDQPNIHVCTVMPSAIDTPIFQHAANYTGRDVQALPPVYPPEQVAEVIVSMVDSPRAEVTVGDAGRLMQLTRSVLPQSRGDPPRRRRAGPEPPRRQARGSAQRQPLRALGPDLGCPRRLAGAGALGRHRRHGDALGRGPAGRPRPRLRRHGGGARRVGSRLAALSRLTARPPAASAARSRRRAR